jgi:predicted DNA-binding transcriptional regulator YafY
MRADRLIAILLLLQETGRITAQALAEELEVSERTIYRDIDALGIAGVPVYSQRGPGGGIALLDSFRTDLTGLTTAELQALLALSIPAPLVDLGIGADLRSALRKLAAAATHSRAELDLRVQDKFFIDNSEWPKAGGSMSVFEIVRRALWDDLELAVQYYSELGSHAGSIMAVVKPYGLVAASGAWHLVAGRDQHTIVIPLARILSAEATAERFNPPQDFQLESFWYDWITRKQLQRPSITVLAVINESALPLIGEYLEWVQGKIPGKSEVRGILRFETFEQARTYILGFGSSIEVIEPVPLRLSIVDYARQILFVYENEPLI